MPLVIAIVVAGAIIAAIVAISRMQRRSTWEGVVVEIKDYLDDDEANGVRRRKSVLYREPSGRVAHFLVDVSDFERHYAGLSVGDRVSKRSGEREPRWVDARE